MPMMAITTNSSTSVKPPGRDRFMIPPRWQEPAETPNAVARSHDEMPESPLHRTG